MLKLKNDGKTTLVSGIDDTVTSFDVTDATVFPVLVSGDWFPMTIVDGTDIERVRVTGISGNTLTVLRGTENTTPMSWVADVSCTFNLTESAMRSMSGYALAEMTGGSVINRIDDNGNNNIMVRIPAFSLDTIDSELGTSLGTGPHPAFIRADGTFMEYFEYSMYQSSDDGAGNPVSAPFKEVYTANYTNARDKCAAKGTGWHLATNVEWAAITWLCLMRGFIPKGNSQRGINHADLWQSSIRPDGKQPGDFSGTGIAYTGSGPIEWRHNGDISGIADLVGNEIEYQDGIKVVDGQIIVADKNGMDENDWVAQAAYYNGDQKLANAKTSNANTTIRPWANQQKDANYVDNPLLQALLIEPVPAVSSLLGALAYNTFITGDIFPRRGGDWADEDEAGLGMLSFNQTATGSPAAFRASYFE